MATKSTTARGQKPRGRRRPSAATAKPSGWRQERQAPAEPSPQELRRLGEELRARSEQVLAETVARSIASGEAVDDTVQERFERICTNSTVAVSRWIAGDGLEVTVDSSRETSQIFGELAFHRAATLHEVTKRSMWWRNVMADTLREIAIDLDTPPEALTHALNMLQLSLEFSLVRICECFEQERERTDEELARREQELAFMATHDPLTGLPNRTLVLARVEQMLARAKRNRTPVAALFVDLDNFKAINDTFGHKVGDELLVAVAERLKGVVREADALGRLGGDEFVVIADELSVAAGPGLVAERLLAALEPTFTLGADGGVEVTVSASIGLASGHEQSAGDLLRDADIAMYRAKLEGRNRYAIYEDGMQDAVQQRLALETDLRGALANDEFRLVYQPTIELSGMRPTGVEALLRWEHPTRGLVQPGDFIPVLEDTGLIVDVGRWVLSAACRQAAAWLHDGQCIGIAVNVSARQLDEDGLVADVAEALADSALPADALTIEITETTLMRNTEETARRLEAIKELGVKIAIDDFGTGYSSLAHLQRFPVDALKIDRSFITGLRQNSQAETLIRTLVQLGKALSVETFAEGIEDEGELSVLRAEDCDSGQGFLFARPLEAAAAAEFFSSSQAGR